MGNVKQLQGMRNDWAEGNKLHLGRGWYVVKVTFASEVTSWGGCIWISEPSISAIRLSKPQQHSNGTPVNCPTILISNQSFMKCCWPNSISTWEASSKCNRFQILLKAFPIRPSPSANILSHFSRVSHSLSFLKVCNLSCSALTNHKTASKEV